MTLDTHTLSRRVFSVLFIIRYTHDIVKIDDTLPKSKEDLTQIEETILPVKKNSPCDFHPSNLFTTREKVIKPPVKNNSAHVNQSKIIPLKNSFRP